LYKRKGYWLIVFLYKGFSVCNRENWLSITTARKEGEVFSCESYNSGHRSNCKFAVNCDYKKERVIFNCKLYKRSISATEGNCKLAVNCDHKRLSSCTRGGRLFSAVNRTKVDFSHRRQL
jgi:hypothetical protein